MPEDIKNLSYNDARDIIDNAIDKAEALSIAVAVSIFTVSNFNICGNEIAKLVMDDVGFFTSLHITSSAQRAFIIFAHDREIEIFGQKLTEQIGDCPIYSRDGIFLGAIKVCGNDLRANDMIASESVLDAGFKVRID